jgi:hypothetical protein
MACPLALVPEQPRDRQPRRFPLPEQPRYWGVVQLAERVVPQLRLTTAPDRQESDAKPDTMNKRSFYRPGVRVPAAVGYSSGNDTGTCGSPGRAFDPSNHCRDGMWSVDISLPVPRIILNELPVFPVTPGLGPVSGVAA